MWTPTPIAARSSARPSDQQEEEGQQLEAEALVGQMDQAVAGQVPAALLNRSPSSVAPAAVASAQVGREATEWRCSACRPWSSRTAAAAALIVEPGHTTRPLEAGKSTQPPARRRPLRRKNQPARGSMHKAASSVRSKATTLNSSPIPTTTFATIESLHATHTSPSFSRPLFLTSSSFSLVQVVLGIFPYGSPSLLLFSPVPITFLFTTSSDQFLTNLKLALDVDFMSVLPWCAQQLQVGGLDTSIKAEVKN